MKKAFFISFGVLTLFACGKIDNNSSISIIDESSKSGSSPSIVGIIDNVPVKTSYTAEGKFSWVENDKIAVQITNGETYSSHLFKAASSAQQTTFSVFNAAIPDGFSLGDYAFYPADLKYSEGYGIIGDLGYNNDNPVTVSLPSITEEWYIPFLSNTQLMQMTPLIGKKQTESEGVVTYKFVSATGMLKLNFSDVPNVSGLRIYLSHPSYPLCGNFSLSEDNTILAENYISGSSTRELRPAPSFTTAYIALPIGTIPAGLTIKLGNTSGDVYSQITTSETIDIERNTVTDLTMSIKALGSSVQLCSTSTSDNPMATVTVADGEAVALATDPNVNTAIDYLKTANISHWRGGVDGGWITVSGDYRIANTNSKKNYLVWKIKAADGHIYYKSTANDAIPYYEINTGMRDQWINGKFIVNNPAMYNSLGHTPTSFTLAMSDDITKGNLMLTEFDEIEGKAYGIYAGGMDFTFPASINKDTPFTTIESKTWYFRNGNESNDVVFTLVAKTDDDLGNKSQKRCYLKSKWCGLKNDNGGNWYSVYYGYESNNTIANFYGLTQ